MPVRLTPITASMFDANAYYVNPSNGVIFGSGLSVRDLTLRDNLVYNRIISKEDFENKWNLFTGKKKSIYKKIHDMIMNIKYSLMEHTINDSLKVKYRIRDRKDVIIYDIHPTIQNTKVYYTQ